MNWKNDVLESNPIHKKIESKKVIEVVQVVISNTVFFEFVETNNNKIIPIKGKINIIKSILKLVIYFIKKFCYTEKLLEKMCTKIK